MLVAAGHAAFYALDIAARRPDLVDKVVLLNPTFRGPLPTAREDLTVRADEARDAVNSDVARRSLATESKGLVTESKGLATKSKSLATESKGLAL